MHQLSESFFFLMLQIYLGEEIVNEKFCSFKGRPKGNVLRIYLYLLGWYISEISSLIPHVPLLCFVVTVNSALPFVQNGML